SRMRLGKKGQDDFRTILSAFTRYLRGGEFKSLLFMEKIAGWPGIMLDVAGTDSQEGNSGSE
ncbi:hypothetical protein ACFL2Q_20040, partial [Thermodesulfobacteriota bacterium]